MRSVPAAAHAYILCAVLSTVLLALPALRPGAGINWVAVALLAGLYAACELPARCRHLGRSVPVSAGSFFPVLLAAAFLLPPSAALLVAIPGALVGRVERRPAALRRIWRAAQLALAIWGAAQTYDLLGGDHAPGPGPSPIDFPLVLLPGAAGALAFCLVLTVLEAGILATAERTPCGPAGTDPSSVHSCPIWSTDWPG